MNKSKNIMAVRMGLIVLAIVLVFSLVVGLTLSKYIKTETKNGTATVAGFGVVMTWQAGDIFKTTYATDNAAKSGTITNSVVAEDDTIAPGTTNSTTLTLSGSSEVAFTFNLDVTELYSNDWKESAEGAVYNPINITITEKVGDAEATPVAGTTVTKDYAAGTIETTVYTVTWTWAFEGNNAADTYMSTVTDATYQLTGTATATQID